MSSNHKVNNIRHIVLLLYRHTIFISITYIESNRKSSEQVKWPLLIGIKGTIYDKWTVAAFLFKEGGGAAAKLFKLVHL